VAPPLTHHSALMGDPEGVTGAFALRRTQQASAIARNRRYNTFILFLRLRFVPMGFLDIAVDGEWPEWSRIRLCLCAGHC